MPVAEIFKNRQEPIRDFRTGSREDQVINASVYPLHVATKQTTAPILRAATAASR